MADCNKKFKYLSSFSGTGTLAALLLPGSCVAAWDLASVGRLCRPLGAQGELTCQHGGSGSDWALGRLGEDRRWHCSHGHPSCCLHPLVSLPFVPQLPCPHSVPIPWGARFSPITLCTDAQMKAHGPSSPYNRSANRKKMHPCYVCTEDISLWEEGKSCLISHTGWLPALQRDGQGCGLVLGLAGSETHHEPQEQKTRSPCPSLAWQLVCPGLHRCFLLAGPAHSGMARVTPLSAAPPRFLPLLARHMASPDSPCRATRAHPEFSPTLHMEAAFNET